MGDNNSSEIRVRPLGEELLKNPQKVQLLLSLIGCNVISSDEFFDASFSFTAERRSEKHLAPSDEHLVGILDLVKINTQAREFLLKGVNIHSKGETKNKRINWINNAPVDDISSIDELKTNRGLLTFEGATRPDLFIEGTSKIILIEGKLTESSTTVDTWYLQKRDQMIRHIQGALEYEKQRGIHKQIVAFYIVPEDFKEIAEISDINNIWERMENESVLISADERKKIASCYYGCTTWEKVGKQLGLEFRAIIEK